MELLRQSFKSIILILVSIMALEVGYCAITGMPTQPGGPNESVQINRKGVFMGYADFTYSSTTKILNVPIIYVGTASFSIMSLSGNRQVEITEPQHGSVLTYDGITGKWKPGDVNTLIPISIYAATDTINALKGIASTTGTFSGATSFTGLASMALLYASSSTLNLVYITTAVFKATQDFPYGFSSSTGVFSSSVTIPYLKFSDNTVLTSTSIFSRYASTTSVGSGLIHPATFTWSHPYGLSSSTGVFSSTVTTQYLKFSDGTYLTSTNSIPMGSSLNVYYATATINATQGINSTTGTFTGQVQIASITWIMGAHTGYLWPNWQTGVTIRPPADSVGGGENPSLTLDGYKEDNMNLKFIASGTTGTIKWSSVENQFYSSDTWKILNLKVSTLTFNDGTYLYSTSTIGSGGSGATNLDGLTDVTITAPAKNQAILYNGTAWVNAAQGTSFTFSISAFSCTSGSSGSTFEMGTGNWKAIGAMSFSATYNNGPATNGYVSHSGWSNLTLGGAGYVGPTTNAEAVSFPSVGGTKVFTLNATDGSASPTSSITYYFYNRRFWGVSSVASGYTEANVEGLANNELSNSKAKTFTVTAGSGEYIIYSYPSRLGTATFTVGGFEGGFNSPETVSITNPSGYSENFYVYRSINSNLGSTTVVAN